MPASRLPGERRATVVLFATMLAVAVPQPGAAQTANRPAAALLMPTPNGVGTVVLVATDAPVFQTPNASLRPFRIAQGGSIVRLLELNREWCRVEFEDPESGPRVGYIRARLKHVGPTGRPGPEDVLSPAIPAQADRGWIGIEISRLQPSEPDHILYGHTVGVVFVWYPGLSEPVAGVRVSGGVRLRGGFGIAGGFNTFSRSRQADTFVNIPSPYVPGLWGDDSALSPFLERRDRAIDFSGVYTTPSADAIRVRLLGGPTYFRVTDHMIASVGSTQAASASPPVNVVHITSFTVQEVSASTLGFHVGIDVSGFFSRHVGVGGSVRFSRGRASVRDPLTNEEIELKVGQPELGGGLRLRF